LPPDAAEIDPVEEHHQVRRLDLHALGLRSRRRGWKAERALLQPLDLGITVPSFLWRYKISARPSCWGRESLVSMANVWDGSWE
jgi:hypothetical protein